MAAISKPLSLPSLIRRFAALVPLGGSLPEDVWRQRHRFLLGLTWFHASIIALVGPIAGYSLEFSPGALFRDGTVLHTVGEGLIVALFAVVGTWKAGRKFRATAASFGLISSSAMLVHLSGGYIELHFHFFVMLAFLALYQDWAPYLLAIAYVAIHHGIVGTLWPEEVYNHTAALNAPWTWAGIHAFFISWSCVGSVIAWRFNEKTSAQTRLILNSVGEGIYGFDREGKVMFANPVAAQTLGLEVEELVGRPIQQILDHVHANRTSLRGPAYPILAALQEGATQKEGHEFFWRSDGTSFPADYVRTSIIERGELTGAVVAFRDVTERERAQEAIRQSQKQYQDLVNSIDGIVWEADAETFRFTFVSEQAERILGYPAERWIKEPNFWADHIHPEDRDWAVAFCVKATEEKRPHRFEYRMMAADGRVVWLGDIITVVVADDRPVKLRGVMIDITERKEAEEKARRNHERIRALHEISAATSSSLELDVILEALMQKLAALLPYTAVQVWLKSEETGRLERSACFNIDREEWMGREPKEIPPLVRAAVESKTCVVSRNIQTDPRTLDREFYKRQGLISYLAVPLVVKDEALGVLVLLTREEHEFSAEETEFVSTLAGQAAMGIYNSGLFYQTRTQAAQLEKANREINDFTAMMAHDLRSPLINVMAVSEMMSDGLFGPVNDEQKKWLGRVVESGRQLVDLVGDFLDVSKLEAGRIDLALEEVNLEKFLNATLDNYHLLAQEKKISLRGNISPSLRLIQADPRRLEQVLSNLLSNALKFTPAGGEIELGTIQNDREVKVWVRDTGIGIAPDEIGQIFEKYKQTTSGKTSEHKGTGLGLVICKMIVEAHGGKIWAESEEGKGTTFTFTIPTQ